MSFQPCSRTRNSFPGLFPFPLTAGSQAPQNLDVSLKDEVLWIHIFPVVGIPFFFPRSVSFVECFVQPDTAGVTLHSAGNGALGPETKQFKLGVSARLTRAGVQGGTPDLLSSTCPPRALGIVLPGAAIPALPQSRPRVLGAVPELLPHSLTPAAPGSWRQQQLKPRTAFSAL